MENNNFGKMLDDELDKNPQVFNQWKNEKKVQRTRTRNADVIDIALRHDISLVKLLIFTIVEKGAETPREEIFMAEMLDFELRHQKDGHVSVACNETLGLIEKTNLRARYTVDAGVPFSEIEQLEKSKEALIRDKKYEEESLNQYTGDSTVWIKIAQKTAKEIVERQQKEDDWNDQNIAIQDMISSLKGGKSLINPFEEDPKILKLFLQNNWNIPAEFARDSTFETSINHAFIQANQEMIDISVFMENLLEKTHKILNKKTSY